MRVGGSEWAAEMGGHASWPPGWSGGRGSKVRQPATRITWSRCRPDASPPSPAICNRWFLNAIAAAGSLALGEPAVMIAPSVVTVVVVNVAIVVVMLRTIVIMMITMALVVILINTVIIITI